MLALLLSPGFVVAINNPLMWESLGGSHAPAAAIAVSGYIGIDRHQALRLNYATYEVDTLNAMVTGFGDAGDGVCAYVHSGHSDDIGAGWMYFTRERWRGPSLELGAVRKSLDTGYCHNNASRDEYASTTHSTSTAYVARAMVAWSWLYNDHIYASFGAGGSLGGEAGTYRESHTQFRRVAAAPEIYFRIGIAFM
jgi:hypothetical protein